MSALPLKADIRQREWHVRYVPLRYVPLEDIGLVGASALALSKM
jgi:hypothetical protein